ncbi:MAG: TusE/DsrC/DsvC family sulfur relay protein [Sodalis sp. (in: enterobacteria)]
MKFNDAEIKTDTQGYLIQPQDWSKALAVDIARTEGLTLSAAHWQVINFVRAFYLQYNTTPTVRMLVKGMGHVYGEARGNSRYLFRLFPQGPAKQATKIAGLPKPVKCL